MLTLTTSDCTEKIPARSADRASVENFRPRPGAERRPRRPRPVSLSLSFSPVLVPLKDQYARRMFPYPFDATLCSLLRCVTRPLLGALGGARGAAGDSSPARLKSRDLSSRMSPPMQRTPLYE